MSSWAADFVASQLLLKPDSILGLPTGKTPMNMYQYLVEMYRQNKISFKYVQTYNIDEFLDIEPDNPISYRSYMNNNFFNKIDIDRQFTYIPPSNPKNPSSAVDWYEKIVTSQPADLQILGIGTNGHIGFNEPGERLEESTHVTELAEETITSNQQLIEQTLGLDSSEAQIPSKAITMGIGTILRAKKILLLASGTEKQPVLKQLLSSGITTYLPASFLKLHSSVTIIADKFAYPDE